MYTSFGSEKSKTEQMDTEECEEKETEVEQKHFQQKDVPGRAPILDNFALDAIKNKVNY